MPTTIIEDAVNLNKQNFIDSNSRYQNSGLIYWGQQKYLTFKTYKRKKYTLSNQDKFWVIPTGLDYRPDIVSLKAYGTVGYWWVLLEANGMLSIMEFVGGKNIIIPSPYLLGGDST